MRSLALRVALVGVALLCLPANAHAAWTSTISGDAATMTATVASSGEDGLIIDHDPTGLLHHNRAGAGDPLFHTSLDFDTGTAGEQTVPNDDSKTVLANGSDGGDAVSVGSATVPASQVQAAFTFNGNAGIDVLSLENEADSSARSYSVGPSQIAGFGGGDVTYTSTESLVLFGGTADDTFGVLSGTTATKMVQGGNGDDTVNLGDGVPIFGFHGGDGTDTLSFSGYTTSAIHTLSPTVENLVGGSTGDDLTGSEDPNRIDGGPGADSTRGVGGSDILAAVDRTADTLIDCGDGISDIANIDLGIDPEPVNCETVNRISGGGPPDSDGGGADTDGDGVPDASDACPTEAGSPSDSGCPTGVPVADRDGDGKSDAEDRCPDRAADTSDGCPEVDRKLTIDRKGGAYEGRLKTTPDTRACESDQKVKIFRKKKGDDKKLGNDRTNGKGAYEVDGSGKDGKYYAQVKEADEVPEAICLAATSKNLKLG